jgi:hypothetical protein
MQLFMAISVEEKAAAALLFSGVIAPGLGIALRRYVNGWSTYGAGPFAILDRSSGRRARAPHQLDPAMQAAEVRQMLIAKAERQRQRGGTELDVEAEATRLLSTPQPPAPARLDAELRAEIRGLVIVRNERRARQGLDPLDVAAETERQLADLGRSGR